MMRVTLLISIISLVFGLYLFQDVNAAITTTTKKTTVKPVTTKATVKVTPTTKPTVIKVTTTTKPTVIKVNPTTTKVVTTTKKSNTTQSIPNKYLRMLPIFIPRFTTENPNNEISTESLLIIKTTLPTDISSITTTGNQPEVNSFTNSDFVVNPNDNPKPIFNLTPTVKPNNSDSTNENYNKFNKTIKPNYRNDGDNGNSKENNNNYKPLKPNKNNGDHGNSKENYNNHKPIKPNKNGGNMSVNGKINNSKEKGKNNSNGNGHAYGHTIKYNPHSGHHD